MQTCECGLICTSKYKLDRHLLSKSHELNMICGGVMTVNTYGNYECELCNYSSPRKDNFRKHVLSAKHLYKKHQTHNEASSDTDNEEAEAPFPTEAEEVPVVSNAYTLENEFVKPVTLKEVMEMFMKHTEMFMKHQETTQIQNTEMFKSLTHRIIASESQVQNNISLENSQVNTTTTTTTTTMNNTTKKKFNLNVFLNEECKNAMNLSDFIQGLVVNMEDLENICELGYTEGMSKIITKAINGKHQTERPIHCSDSKRETMYVKKDDVWFKDSNKEECQRLIDHITSKNYKFMKKWCDENPGYVVSDSPDYDKWYSITRALCNTDPKARKKLMRHLALTTEIEKDDFQRDDAVVETS